MSQTHTTDPTTPEGASSLIPQPTPGSGGIAGEEHQDSDGRDETNSSDYNITVRESDAEKKKREAKEDKEKKRKAPVPPCPPFKFYHDNYKGKMGCVRMSPLYSRRKSAGRTTSIFKLNVQRGIVAYSRLLQMAASEVNG